MSSPPAIPLVTLDDTQALARWQELRDRYIDLRALEARLMAEMQGLDAIAVPAELLAFPAADYARAVEDQRALFTSRRASQSGRDLILQQRVKQVEEQIAGLTEMIAAEDEQIGLLEQEAASVKQLYDKGLERLPRLLELQREAASVVAERAANRAAIAQNHQLIGETRMQLLALRDEIVESVSEDLSKVRGELAELSSQMNSREDVCGPHGRHRADRRHGHARARHHHLGCRAIGRAHPRDCARTGRSW